MGNPFDHFVSFLGAVWVHALTLAAGCVVTVVMNLIEKHWMNGKKLPLKANVSILLCFAFYACFQAWHDEYERANALMHPPPFQPVVNVNVPQGPAPQVIVEQARSETPPAKLPVPSISFEARKRAGNLNEVQLFVTAKGDIAHPAFRVLCDHPCRITSGQYLGGATSFEASALPLSVAAQGRFIIPAVIKNGEQVILDLQSPDDQIFQVVNVSLLRRKDGRFTEPAPLQ